MRKGSVRPAYLLPGFDGSGKLFGPLINHLGSSFDCLPITYSAHRALRHYVAEAREQMICAESSVLVAESFSGPIAIALAAQYPELVGSLILSATFDTAPHKPLIQMAGSMPSVALGSQHVRRFLVRNLCLDAETDESATRQVMDVVTALRPSTIRARLRAMAEFDVRRNLSVISVPTLILGASRDRILGNNRPQRLHTLIRGSRIAWVDGPHLLLQSRPMECAHHIRKHVGA